MNVIIAWTFIFAVPLFAFVYAWFFKKPDMQLSYAKEVDDINDLKGLSSTLLLFACVWLGIWLLNLPA